MRVGRDHVALVDAADLGLVNRWKWKPLLGHNSKVYAVRSTARGAVYMHRVILRTADGFETDHINGNGLDNRRANLRLATRGQNKANMGKPTVARGSSSRFKGVHRDKRGVKWVAQIRIDGHTTHLGTFERELDAARAYDKAAHSAWGSYAFLNFGGDS